MTHIFKVRDSIGAELMVSARDAEMAAQKFKTYWKRKGYKSADTRVMSVELKASADI